MADDSKTIFINFEKKLLDPSFVLSVDETEISEFKEVYQLLKLFENGNFGSLLEFDCTRQLLLGDRCEALSQDLILKNVANYLSSAHDASDLTQRHFKILIIGATFLMMSIQNNWTGPEIILRDLNLQNTDWNLNIFEEDSIYSKAKCLEYLWLAKILLFYHNDDCYKELKSSCWWRIRFLKIYQVLLEERSSKVYNLFCQELDKLMSNPSFIESLSLNLKVQLHLELFNSYLYYYEYEKAKNHLQTAQETIKMSVELTGVLGKRTRWQAHDVAQLALNIVQDISNDSDHAFLTQTHLPKDLNLNDDVRLDKIQFNDEKFNEIRKLTQTEQIVIVCIFVYLQKTNPRDKLTIEELLTYANLVLSHPQCWSVQAMALYLRSSCETDHRRTIERSMMQMQELVDQYSSNEALAAQRIHLLFSVGLPPKWIMEKSLARMLIQLGAVASALDIFLRLEMWNDVIKCYHSMQRRDKAEAVIREQLAVKETPSLWCCLGDATDDPQYYLKAWELSNHKSARAQKALGVLHFKKKEYDQCVDCLNKSVEINSIQTDTWFRLGFAAMQIENWEVAAKAYRRCVNLEPDNFEAWNNLANVYIKQKQKYRAWIALQEALKCQFEEVKLWENFLLVSVDIGQISEAIKAYHRVLDNNERFTDAEVLELMVKALKKNDSNNTEDTFNKLAELFGRVTAKVVNNSLIWKHYGDLINSKPEKTCEDFEKVIRLYEKSQRCAVQMTPKWETDPSNCLHVLQLTLDLSNLCIEFGSNEITITKRQMLTSSKMMMNNVIVKVKSYLENNGVTPTEDVSALLGKLQIKLEAIKQLLE